MRLFVSLDFCECDDTFKTKHGNLDWEVHRGGEIIKKSRYGCCSTIAAWVYYMLFEIYEEVGYICLYRNTGTGHVFNYILNDNKIYIIDFLPLLKKYANLLCIQTGEIKDFVKVKLFTGLLYEVDSFDSFALFFSRMTKLSGIKQIFWRYSATEVSPIAVEEDRGMQHVYIPESYKFVQFGNRMKEIDLRSFSLEREHF